MKRDDLLAGCLVVTVWEVTQMEGSKMNEWSAFTKEDLGREWLEVHPEKEVAGGVAMSLGEGDATCAFIVYVDGWLEVGVGNPCRPYLCLYSGWDTVEAMKQYVKWCQTFEEV